MMEWKHYVSPDILKSLRQGEKDILDALEVHVDLPLRLRGENDSEYLERWVNSGGGVIADWEVDIVRRALKFGGMVGRASAEDAEDSAQREFMMHM
jgi:hypothetical protein